MGFQNDDPSASNSKTFLPRFKTFRKRIQVSLANLPVRQYVDTVAKVASVKVTEIEDTKGVTKILTGVLEDDTFKVPFICRKINLAFEKNLVLTVHSAYVHEFEDRALLLILTKDAYVEPKYGEDPQKYVWYTKIGCIHRPVWNVELKGTVTRIHGSSGLVKRCSRCNAIFYDRCMNGCEDGWEWDLRVATSLQDNTGSIKMILGRGLSSRLLGRNLSDILAKAQHIRSSGEGDVCSFKTAVPELDVIEAVVDDLHQHRQHDQIMISDGKTRIYFLPPIKIIDPIKMSRRRLASQNTDDNLLLQRLTRKALNIRITQITGKPYIHGIHLLEKPVLLHSSEKARLYLGFSTNITITSNNIIVEASPQAYVRESIWEYIQWRQSRGDNVSAIQRTILQRGDNVVLAPFGHVGRIEDVINIKAGEAHISEFDKRSFAEFWLEMYDFDVDSTETPLLKARLRKLNLPLIYPPSCVYFDQSALCLTANTQHYIKQKRSSLKRRTQAVMEQAFQGLKLGNIKLRCLSESKQRVGTQQLLLYKLRQKLLSHPIQARGNIVQLKDRFYFLPYTIRKVE